MASQSSTDSKTKKPDPFFKILKAVFNIIVFSELRGELKKTNNRLLTVIELVGNMDGKFKDKNPLKQQLRVNEFIILIALILPILLVLFIIYKFPTPVMFEYLKIIPKRLFDCIRLKQFSADHILAKDLVAYYVARSWAILFLIHLTFCAIISKLILKNLFMIEMTKKFKEQALKGGFIKEDGPGEVLMTPVGLLINLESGSETSFINNDDLWNQLNIYPGKVYNSKVQRTLIFATIVQPLKSEYKYFEDNSIEIKK